MNCSWIPKAFSNIRLNNHNKFVGVAVSVIFKDRLKNTRLLSRPLNRLLMDNETLYKIAVLSAILHDIGKASPYYADKNNFFGHEGVGAIIIQHLKNFLLGKQMYNEVILFELISWIIARHHVAMKERHPYQWDNIFIKNVINALEELRREPECLLMALPNEFRGSKLERILHLVLGKMKINYDSITKLRRQLVKISPGLFSLVPAGTELMSRWLAYVSIATGSVIVSDIIVASIEGRETDEKIGRVYLRWWRKEIGEENISRLKSLINSQLTPITCISNIVEFTENILRKTDIRL